MMMEDVNGLDRCTRVADAQMVQRTGDEYGVVADKMSTSINNSNIIREPHTKHIRSALPIQFNSQRFPSCRMSLTQAEAALKGHVEKHLGQPIRGKDETEGGSNSRNRNVTKCWMRSRSSNHSRAQELSALIVKFSGVSAPDTSTRLAF
jgi:hypothetical protein